LKFSFGTKSKIKTKKTILFVCVENAGRSQIAEGFFKKYAPEGYEPLSAGTRPVSQINPLAIQVMNEVGLDISKQKVKGSYRRYDEKFRQDCQYGLYGQGFLSNLVYT
jgi:arsenate reductase (thioredoxin)